MQSSNIKPWLGLVLTGSALGLLQADHLTLADSARLTGAVRSLNEAGVIELASPLSPEPLFLKTGAVTKVEFSAPASEPTRRTH